jgi:hypothetical protein
MRIRTMSIVALCVFLNPSNSYAQPCADGRQVTITGTLAKKKELGEFAKKLQSNLKKYSDPGTTSLDVASSTPCEINILTINGVAPAACVGGARFKASGKVQDVIETFLDVKSITCR